MEVKTKGTPDFILYLIGAVVIFGIASCFSGGGGGEYSGTPPDSDQYRDAPTGRTAGGDTW